MARFPAQFIISPQIVDLTTIVSGISSIISNPATAVINPQDQLGEAEINMKKLFQGEKSQLSEADITRTQTGLEATAKMQLQRDKLAEFATFFSSVLTPEGEKAVTGITRSGTVATVTTTLAHNYYAGDTVTIADATETAYNGSFQITAIISPTKFTYTVSGSPTSPATGTITVQSNQHGLVALSDEAGCTFGDADLPFKTIIVRPVKCGEPVSNPELWVIYPFASIEPDYNPRLGLGTQFSYDVMVYAYPDPITGRNRVLRGNTALLV
jgi:hypothetical protein